VMKNSDGLRMESRPLTRELIGIARWINVSGQIDVCLSHDIKR
jgi:hypothetical protein